MRKWCIKTHTRVSWEKNTSNILQTGEEAKKDSYEGGFKHPQSYFIKSKGSETWSLEQEHKCVDLKSDNLTLSTNNPIYFTMTWGILFELAKPQLTET